MQITGLTPPCLCHRVSLPCQVVFEPQTHPEASKLGSRLRSEWVVAVKGQLRKRKDPNSKIKTGQCSRRHTPEGLLE